jgi:hypothetical protein
MKSGKQRRGELNAKREAKRAAAARKPDPPPDAVLVNLGAMAPDGSYDSPAFVKRGYYVDQPFKCKDCGKQEVWKARQQKWWYEVAKGGRWTAARRCRPCRQKERARREEARKVHLDGLARKNAAHDKPSAQT